MGIAIGVCTPTLWWYPDLAGDQVTQNLNATRQCRPRSPRASIFSFTSRGVLSYEPLKRLTRVVHYSWLERWALTRSIRICSSSHRTAAQGCAVGGWFSRKVNCHA